jgi:hypothetical protein
MVFFFVMMGGFASYSSHLLVLEPIVFLVWAVFQLQFGCDKWNFSLELCWMGGMGLGGYVDALFLSCLSGFSLCVINYNSKS